MRSRRVFLRETFQIVGGLTLAACACGPSLGNPLASAPPTTAPATGKRGGQLVFADITDPKSLDPALITDRTGARAQRAIYDPLIDLDENSTLVPGLAESWEIASDAKSPSTRRRSRSTSSATRIRPRSHCAPASW